MRYMSVARERPPVERIVRPFQDFADKQSSGGILLLAATAIALAWANSPWGESYAALWHTKLTVGVGDFSITKDLTHWINDGLMAVFFLVVGLEIKREVLVGELSSVGKAALPVIAALGGAVVPALIFLAINAGTEGSAGWGVPMATDIAFALGVLALLGQRAPTALKVFLTALAIVDDGVDRVHAGPHRRARRRTDRYGAVLVVEAHALRLQAPHRREPCRVGHLHVGLPLVHAQNQDVRPVRAARGVRLVRGHVSLLVRSFLAVFGCLSVVPSSGTSLLVCLKQNHWRGRGVQTGVMSTLLSRLSALAISSITMPKVLARVNMTSTFGSSKFWVAMIRPAAVLRCAVPKPPTS